MAPFLVSSVLNLIVAQRLVRKICEKCVYSYESGPEVAAIVEKQFKEAGLSFQNKLVPKVLYRGKGCLACGGTGYHGRMGIFEILEVGENVKKIISNPKFDLNMLRNEASSSGMKTMFEDGLRKVELALTTLDEVLRVVME